MRTFIKLTTTLILIGCTATFAQSSQDELKEAQKLWQSRQCKDAYKKMENVHKRLADFPESVRPKIEEQYLAWTDSLETMQTLEKEIRNGIPEVLDNSGKPLPLAQLQESRDSLNHLLAKAERIYCRDLKMPLVTDIQMRLRAANTNLDNFVENILAENAKLSTSIDSLQKIAKKYKILLHVVDSLKSEIARNADNLDKVQKQVDLMLAMAQQTSTITTGDLGTAVKSPIETVAEALLTGVENKIFSIGEGKIRNRNLKQEQKDSIAAQLDTVVAWLDSSIVAKNAPERANSLKMLANDYLNLMNVERPFLERYKWFILGGLGALALVAVIIGILKMKTQDREG